MERRAVYAAALAALAAVGVAAAAGAPALAAHAQAAGPGPGGPLTARCGFLRVPDTDSWVRLDAVVAVAPEVDSPGTLTIRVGGGSQYSLAGTTMEQFFQLCEQVAPAPFTPVPLAPTPTAVPTAPTPAP